MKTFISSDSERNYFLILSFHRLIVGLSRALRGLAYVDGSTGKWKCFIPLQHLDHLQSQDGTWDDRRMFPSRFPLFSDCRMRQRTRVIVYSSTLWKKTIFPRIKELQHILAMQTPTYQLSSTPIAYSDT